jgi:hypothetical protein
VEPLLVPILGVWLLMNLAPVDLASGDAAESLLVQPGLHASQPADDGDADADGIPDALDVCDETPPGYPVLPNGCSSDTDGDGVSDGRDRCPETLPGSLDIDPAGCSQKDRKKDRPYRYAVGVA